MDLKYKQCDGYPLALHYILTIIQVRKEKQGTSQNSNCQICNRLDHTVKIQLYLYQNLWKLFFFHSAKISGRLKYLPKQVS